MGLNCTATDMVGDGYVGAGDFLRLTVVDGEFSESSDYMAYLMDRYSGSVICQVLLTG